MVSKTGIQKSTQFQLWQESQMRGQLPPELPFLDRKAKGSCFK